MKKNYESGISTAKMLDMVLSDLKRTGDIEASAVVSRDGSLITSDISGDVHAEAFAAMSATMLGAAETATAELKKGIPDRIIVEFKEGRIIARGVSPKALLITMTGPHTGLGLILVEVERAVEKIKEWGTAMQIRSGTGFLKWLGGSACAEFMIGLFFAAVAISFGIAVHWHYFPLIIVGLLIALHGYYREFG